MSNPDSFINEVTEEVRRDRMFRLLRRYGWIAVLVVALIVGGAAWNEWQKARDRAAAEAFGDALLLALDNETPQARRAALDGVQAQGDGVALLAMMQAAESLETGEPADRAAAIAALQSVAQNAALAPVWRDLAQLRVVMAQGAGQDAAARRAALEPLTQPGRPYRTLVQEQLALIAVEQGDIAGALQILRALDADQETPSGLRRRAAQLIVVLEGMAAGGGQTD